MIDLNTNRSYYTVRGCNLEDEDYYSAIKNQTFQQNSFFCFNAPRVIMSSTDPAGTATLGFFGTFLLKTNEGKLTFTAMSDTSYVDGTFIWSLNGTAQGSKTSNPAEILHSDVTGSFIAGLNYIDGTFVPDSGSAYSFAAYWGNGWEA
ncbi:MAG: hypothetical protein KAU20_02025 [Nanoarchaeota archaeon]|nr:hypothetical protein [Nanoarchaeota archaeon]